MQTLSIRSVSVRPSVCLRQRRAPALKSFARSRQWNRIYATEEPTKETAAASSETAVSKDEKPAEEIAGAPPEQSKAADIGQVEQPERTPLSKGMKDKMREEYIGLGGAENTKMGQNWFLIISGVVAALAIAAYVSGSIGI